MPPRRKVAVTKQPPIPKRTRSSLRGASTSQAPSTSEIRSKRRHEAGIPSATLPTHEESREEEDVGEEGEAQSELPVRYFGNPRRRTYFYAHYAKRKVHEPKKVDFSYMTKYKLRIEEWMTYQGWVDLLTVEDPYYPTLVQIFHCNFNPDNFSSFVKEIDIDFGATYELAYETLGVILGVPHQEDPLLDEVDIQFILNELTHSNDHTAATSAIKANTLSEEARILRLILANCILPKTGSRDSVTQKEAEIIWKIMHYKKVNLPKEIFRHIAACNKDRGNLVLPYSSWLTGVFKFFGVVMRNETAVNLGKRAIIGETSIKLMDISVLAIQARREDEERLARAAREEEGEGERDEADVEREAEEGSQGEDSHPTARPEDYSFQPRVSQPSPPDVAETSVPRPHSEIMTFLHSFQSSVMAEFQTIHSSLATIVQRQDVLEASIASLSSAHTSVPPSTSQPSAPSDAPL